MDDPRSTLLLRRLTLLGADELATRALELRGAVDHWLTYIPATFPHYTRHTIAHSDEIVHQLDKMLFEDDDVRRPVPKLSAVEIYVLIASAYLHDAGMVVSDTEKATILGSDEWLTWTTTGGGARRWAEIADYRKSDPDDPVLRDFLADVQVRYLIAEFVRRIHHTRARTVIRQHENALAQFAFGETALASTVADVCVGHGLTPRELEDPIHYPDRRDVHGQQVNVRLLAILLRLGDLLDMSHDRACPLVTSAASPLPPSSLAHWSQYSRITHRLTTPDTIEIRAECETLEEHRLLYDWCTWIEQETVTGRNLGARFRRHIDWRPPYASLTSATPTIVIAPKPSAKYIPTNWTIDLDAEQVLDRLIGDLYNHPLVFVRELIQNAADATRCAIHDLLQADGEVSVGFPVDVDDELRAQHPIRVTIGSKTIRNELSGEEESRTTVTVEDRGIGMDRDVIERYFLQVGRSFYTSPAFRRAYSFVPTSRFGLGFLSVFGVSDDVVVETYRRASADGPLRLALAGPRRYLLTERSERANSGTSITVTLRSDMDAEEDLFSRLVTYVREWCRKLEFPVFVKAPGQERCLLAERTGGREVEVSGPDEAGRLITTGYRSFPIMTGGIQGEIYLAYERTRGEEIWRGRRTEGAALQLPASLLPEAPPSYLCLHGITVASEVSWGFPFVEGAICVDVRKEIPSLQVPLGRELPGYAFANIYRDPEFGSAVTRLVVDHITSSSAAALPGGYAYRNSVVDIFGELPALARSLPGTVPVGTVDGHLHAVSLAEFLHVPEFWYLAMIPGISRDHDMDLLGGRKDISPKAALRAVVPAAQERAWLASLGASSVLTDKAFSRLSYRATWDISANYVATEVRVRSKVLAVRFLAQSPARQTAVWVRPSEAYDRQRRLSAFHHLPPETVFVVPFRRGKSKSSALGTVAPGAHHSLLLNPAHPLTAWLLAVIESKKRGELEVDELLLAEMIGAIAGAVDRFTLGDHALRKLLAYWRTDRHLGRIPPPEDVVLW